MSLAPGARLGAYEVLGLIGAGGMGEVYRANDTKLHRDVAIKVLPDIFANDPERLARFQREAQVLASLNHPNIAAIYGLEDADGVALVLELVEGDTLAERLSGVASDFSRTATGPAKAGPHNSSGIPLPEALAIARQIAEALETAHEHGIIHRDLKPANIKLRPDGTVKVLDFGLAKLADPVAAGLQTGAPALSQSPTITTPATRMGVIMGTAAYMSPEQAKGRPVDKRADIWAFGCVLYEMLTGRKAFAGDDVADTLAFIITKEPDWSALPEQTPSAIRRLLRRALEKDRRERLPDIGVARIEINEALATPDAELIRPAEFPRYRRERIVWASVATITTAAAIVLGTFPLRTSLVTDAPLIRLSVVPPQNVTFSADSGRTIPAVSPDGRRVAFVATRAGVPLLWVRSLDSLEAQPLPGTDGASFPFWSPDGRAVGFFAGNRLQTIDASGGSVRTLCRAPNVRGFAGGHWISDGVIVFGSQLGGLFTVSANGGSPMPLTTANAAQGDSAHRFPSFLPDGRHFLYLATPSNTILLGSLDSQETTGLFAADSQAVYVAPGLLLFVRQRTLLAQPFSAARAALTGEAVPIAEQVLPDSSGGAAFAASSSGVLAYRTGTVGAPTQLTWVDRSGRPLGTIGQPSRYRNPELSPDGTRVAVEAVDPQGRTQDIWVVELARGVASRLTFDPGNDIYPVWSPDSKQIIFASERGGVLNLYQKRADGVGTEEAVLKSSTDMSPYSWSPDGRFVVYRTIAVDGPTNLGILPLLGERTPRLFEPSKFNQGTGQVSPDGRWLAYVSGESGRNEIYVQGFPTPGAGKVQISRDGSSFVRWRRDSSELFYYASDGKLMAVPVMGAKTLDAGAAIPLFEPHTLNGPTPLFGLRQQYDVMLDGRFLLNMPVEDAATPTSITVIVNWEAELTK